MTSFGSRQRQPASGQSVLFQVFLIFLLLSYWIFARYLERVDLRPFLEQWWRVWVPLIELPQFMVAITELFHPRVLRHLIVVGVGWYLAQRAALSLVQLMYDLPDKQATRQLLSRLRMTAVPAGKPQKVSSLTLENERAKSDLLRVGGPGRVSIASGDVAVTELNGRYHRILGPGTQILRRLEYIHTILDLRPQERQATEVRLITRDGIEVNADITVIFRVDTGGNIATKDNPYPYNEDAVRRLAYNKTVLPDGEVSHWDNAPLGNIRSNLTKIIANYRLDELLHTRSTVDPYQAIRTELLQLSRPFLTRQGIELTNLQISRLELPDDVAQQYVNYWKTHWETQINLQIADGKAMALEEIEIARAEAEMTMIQAIIEGVQRAKRVSNVNDMREIVALRLVEALEKIAEQSQETAALPDKLLSEIQSLQEQLKLQVGDKSFGAPKALDT